MKLKTRSISQGLAGAGLALSLGATAAAEMDPYIGTMRMVGENFCPRGWAAMDGQTMSIAQNTALFSLIGCQFGGDCKSTFKLPDMRGRTPVHGPVGSIGQASGAEAVALTPANLPPHNHTLNASNRPGTLGSPTGHDLAEFAEGTINGYTTSAPGGATMANGVVGTTGMSDPVPVRDPYQVVNWCIATVGIYPSRP